MNRFPDEYTKPYIISINDGLSLGWNAGCVGGDNPSTSCIDGTGVLANPGDGFIDPEILHQTERRSNILTD